MVETYIGIDPGKKGGIAAITVKDGVTTGYHIEVMPEVFKDAYYSIGALVPEGHVKLLIEQVQYRPNQRGVINMLTNYGRLLAYIEILEIPYEIISAQKWKKHYKLGKDKIDSINLANSMFSTEFKKTQDGLAEALLIANYAKEKQK